jgi:hypothetical protein
MDVSPTFVTPVNVMDLSTERILLEAHLWQNEEVDQDGILQ